MLARMAFPDARDESATERLIVLMERRLPVPPAQIGSAVAAGRSSAALETAALETAANETPRRRRTSSSPRKNSASDTGSEASGMPESLCEPLIQSSIKNLDLTGVAQGSASCATPSKDEGKSVYMS